MLKIKRYRKGSWGVFLRLKSGLIASDGTLFGALSSMPRLIKRHYQTIDGDTV